MAHVFGRANSLTTRRTRLGIAGLAFIIVAASPAYAGVGNGAPNGPHFNLNLIGAKTTNCPQTESSGGNVIFVALFGNSKIELQQGTTFAVLDNNACTDGVAQFQLPPPTDVNTGAQQYTVWARVEGTPGGSGTITTCGVDATGTTICSLGTTISTRDLKQNFHNVTTQLTQVCGVINGVQQCVDIFNSALTNYFWSYDNQGNKVLQLRFYPVS
jgi:hypothetical protein